MSLYDNRLRPVDRPGRLPGRAWAPRRHLQASSIWTKPPELRGHGTKRTWLLRKAADAQIIPP